MRFTAPKIYFLLLIFLATKNFLLFSASTPSQKSTLFCCFKRKGTQKIVAADFEQKQTSSEAQKSDRKAVRYDYSPLMGGHYYITYDDGSTKIFFKENSEWDRYYRGPKVLSFILK